MLERILFLQGFKLIVMSITDTLLQVKQASRALPLLEEERINEVLRAVSEMILNRTDVLLEANAEDLRRMNPSDPKYDRLKLTPDRLKGIASDMMNVASLPSPLNRILEETVRPNGLRLRAQSDLGRNGASQRVALAEGECAFRCHRHHLRGAPQCELRCVLALFQERKRVCVKRRARCGLFEPCHCGVDS